MGPRSLAFFALFAISLQSGLALAEEPSAATSKAKAKIAAVAADHARAQIGIPYKFAGSTPKGFDCSGLVYYSFKKAGVAVPRRAADQRSISMAVKRSQVRKGDLVFFNEDGKRASHVGIYLGQGRFVHAPSTGGRVKIASLRSTYWKRSFNEMRRVPISHSVNMAHRGHGGRRRAITASRSSG